MTNLVAFVPDGVGVRNFVVGPFLKRAVERGGVHAFHRIPDELLSRYQLAASDRVRWQPCLPYRDGPWTCFLRKSLTHAHLCLGDTVAMRYARALPVKGSVKTRGMTYLARACGRLSQSSRGVERLSRWHDRAAARMPEVREYRERFERLRPTVLFCSHQRPLEVIAPVLAAKSLGIPTATFIFSWDNITSKGRIAASFDHFLVWSDLMKRELLEYYPEVPQEQVHVVGTPQFDPYADPSLLWSREEFCRRVGADPLRPMICYSGGEPGTTPEDPDHLRGLLRLVRQGAVRGNPQVLLRPAPVTRTDERSRYAPVCREFPELVYCHPQWLREASGDWSKALPSQEDVQFLANLTQHVDVNVNVASTMTLDFAIRDRPVVNVAFDVADPPLFQVPLRDYYYNFEHYRPVVELGASRLAHSPEELAAHVNGYLDDPSLDRAERRRLVELEVDLPIGRSSDRIIDVLERIGG